MRQFFLSLVTLLFCLPILAQDYHANQVMVMLNPETAIEDFLEQGPQNAQLQIEKRLSPSMNLWLLQFDSTQLTVPQMLESLKDRPEVLIIQANHTNVELRTNIPNDPNFNQQWAFTASALAGAIEAPLAWDITTGGTTAMGDNIVVAVVDGGANLNHPDLNFWVNQNEIPNNNIDDDGNGYVDDYEGWNPFSNNDNISADDHGTHVSGTIGAKTNNGVGVAGVNWGLDIMAIEGSSGQESIVVEAYAYIMEQRRLYNQTDGQKGAYVVATNSSFGVNFGNPAQYPIWCAMYDSLGKVGVLSAGATANLNINIDSQGDVPTACPSPYMIAVTNTTTSGAKYSGAGYGVQSIDIGAPGTNINSTRTTGYGNKTGTSMATPHVAGTIALMYANICENALMDYETHPDSLARFVLEKLYTQGYDSVGFLNGLVSNARKLNLRKAVEAARDYNCIQYTTEQTEEDTCGTCLGSVNIGMNDGAAPFTFAWSDGGTQETRSDLCTGVYQVTVTDDLGYQKLFQVNVQGNQAMLLSGTDAGNGQSYAATVQVTGGTPGYTYLWSDGQTTDTAYFQTYGLYTVTATDAMGCTENTDVNLWPLSTSELNSKNAPVLYPIPVSTQLNIQSQERIESVFIFSADGKPIDASNRLINNQSALEMNDLPTGVYIIQIEAGGEQYQQSIIKQ